MRTLLIGCAKAQLLKEVERLAAKRVVACRTRAEVEATIAKFRAYEVEITTTPQCSVDDLMLSGMRGDVGALAAASLVMEGDFRAIAQFLFT